MKDIEIIWNIVLNNTYSNKVLLECELSKIEDKRLAIGGLLDIMANLDKLQDIDDEHNMGHTKVTKEQLMETVANIVSVGDYKEGYGIECYNLFKNEIRKFTNNMKNEASENIESIKFTINLIGKIKELIQMDVNIEDSEELCNTLYNSTEEDINSFKETMIKYEKYEIIDSVNKILNKKPIV